MLTMIIFSQCITVCVTRVTKIYAAHRLTVCASSVNMLCVMKYVDDLTFEEEFDDKSESLVKVEGMTVHQAFNLLLMIFTTGQYQTISCSIQLSVMSCKFILAKKSNRSLTCILLTIILKLSRRLNCLVLPSSVISSGTAKLITS